MSDYEKQTWITGEIITQQKLNHMEDGIANAGGGGGTEMEDALVMRTISGSYYNNRVPLIGYNAFGNCYELTSVDFPMCTSINSYAFSQCSNLTSINFPICTTIDERAFQACYGLTTVDFPACTQIGSYAFNLCTNLTTAIFPVCTTINNAAFYNCYKLTTINLSTCETIGSYAFSNCSNLSTISFPVCKQISNYAFSKCYNLLSAYFLGSSVPGLTSSYVFNSTPIAGYTASTSGVYGSIYVRASMLAAFKSAYNWSYFSSRMVGLTDEQIAALQ